MIAHVKRIINSIILCFLFFQSCNRSTEEKTFYNPFDYDIQYGNIQWVETEYFHVKMQNEKIVQGSKEKNDIHRRQFFTKRQEDWNWHYYLCKKEGYCSGMYDITIDQQHHLKRMSKLDSSGGVIETEQYHQITDSTTKAIVDNYFWKTRSVKFYTFKNQCPVRALWFDPDSILTHDIIYTYDQRGFIKEKKEILIQTGDTLITSFECDKWGHPVKKRDFKNNNLQSEWMCQYELDKHHNWTKATIFIDNTPKYIANQRFIYSSAVKDWNL